MKKILFLTLFILAVPFVFGQFRLEAETSLSLLWIESDVAPFNTSSPTYDYYSSSLLKKLEIYLQAKLNYIQIGGGIKSSFTSTQFIAYPAALLEINMKNLSFEGTLGGLFYYYDEYGPYKPSEIVQENNLVSEASIWLGLGAKKSIRIGVGAFGQIPSAYNFSYLPSLSVFIGSKLVI